MSLHHESDEEGADGYLTGSAQPAGASGDEWLDERLSAICHGTAYGLLDHYMMVDVPDSELKALAPNLSVVEVVNVAILSMQAYLGAIEFDSRLYGWDPEDVARQRQEFGEQMLAVLPR